MFWTRCGVRYEEKNADNTLMFLAVAKESRPLQLPISCRCTRSWQGARPVTDPSWPTEYSRSYNVMLTVQKRASREACSLSSSIAICRSSPLASLARNGLSLGQSVVSSSTACYSFAYSITLNVFLIIMIIVILGILFIKLFLPQSTSLLTLTPPILPRSL